MSNNLTIIEPYIKEGTDIRLWRDLEEFGYGPGQGSYIIFTAINLWEPEKEKKFSFEYEGPVFDRCSFLFLHARELVNLLLLTEEQNNKKVNYFCQELENKQKKSSTFGPLVKGSYLAIQISLAPDGFSTNFPDKPNFNNFIPEYDKKERYRSSESKEIEYRCLKNLLNVYYSHVRLFLYKKRKEIIEIYKKEGYERVILWASTFSTYAEEERAHCDENCYIIFDSSKNIEEMPDLPIYNRDGSEFMGINPAP